MTEFKCTADLVDEYGDQVEVCDTQFRQFGGRVVFSGQVRTVRCFEDVGLLWEVLRTPGDGCVLVVDGGGSVHSTLMGGLIGESAARNGWAGVVINGAVRDCAELAELPIGVRAVGVNPRRSTRTGEGEADVVLTFGNATFRPGDTLVADEDGVVLLPAGTVQVS
ncbi:ribonuclease E activity regulator RraA [Lentzea sp. NPDC004782]|uniref:ribonuclease E activity regulator RraA n=1 Tax=Lentzea sp. NPDC004782 TaxID=3154458 RepID=UPI0033AA9DD8